MDREKITVMTVFTIYMLFQLGNHVAKCTDALVYDMTMLGQICMFLAMVWYLWD